MDRFNTESLELEIPKVSCFTCIHNLDWCAGCLDYSDYEAAEDVVE